MSQEVVAIIQARMGSSRLPGKVLMDIAGRPVLWHLVRRAQRATTLSRIVVATSIAPADMAIVTFCASMGVACVRGPEHDVLDRYYQVARQENAEVIVRLTADCPLHDPVVIDRVVTCFLTGAYDYVSNVNPPSFPDGLDTEVFSFAALQRAWHEATDPYEREHVTPYIRRHPELFRLGNVTHSESLSDLRWTLDEPADLDFIRAVYEALGMFDFGMYEVCELLARQPALRQLNRQSSANTGVVNPVPGDQTSWNR